LDIVVQQMCSISMVVREGIESPRDKKLVLSGFSNRTTNGLIDDAWQILVVKRRSSFATMVVGFSSSTT
jgi:hypothetical protein